MNNEDKTYNGWRNYATWRIQLELVDDYINSMLVDEDGEIEEVTPSQLEDYVDECLTNFGEIENGIALDYARSFVSDVDWYELAEHANDAIAEHNKELQEVN